MFICFSSFIKAFLFSRRASCHRVCLRPSPACGPLLRWAELWVDGRCWEMFLPDVTPPSAAGEKWLFYSAGPLDGESAFTFWGCEMKPGSRAGAFDCNEAHQACHLQEVRTDDSDLPCSSAAMPQLLCKEPGAEPCWSLVCFWGGTLQNRPLLFLPCPC